MKKMFSIFIMVVLLVSAFVSPVAAKSSNGKEILLQKQEKEVHQQNALKKEAKQQLKQIRQQLKKKNLSAYGEEELQALHQKIEEIKAQYSNVRVLPFENIISRRACFKFDTPPVIKAGRTLVPVRALTEAYGADVSWDAENKKVTIVKDDKTIELYLNQVNAYVNGEQIELDVPAEIMHSRTVIPLRFILEALGYDVEYDSDADTIEIIEDDDDDEVRTDSAITV